MTEDQLIPFIAGLPGVVAVTASEANGAPEVAWGDSFFFYDPEGDEPADRRLPFATIVTQDYDGFDMASNLNRHGIYRLNLAVGQVRFGQLVGYPPAQHAAHGGLRLRRVGLRSPTPRVCRPSVGVDSESERQDKRIGALPDRRGPQARSGTSSAAQQTSWYRRLPMIRTWRYYGLGCYFGDKVKVLCRGEGRSAQRSWLWQLRSDLGSTLPMPALIGKEHLDHYCPVFHRGGWYSVGMNDSGGGRSLPRSS